MYCCRFHRFLVLVLILSRMKRRQKTTNTWQAKHTAGYIQNSVRWGIHELVTAVSFLCCNWKKIPRRCLGSFDLSIDRSLTSSTKHQSMLSRMVSFAIPPVTAVHSIPAFDETNKQRYFYTKDEITRFKAEIRHMLKRRVFFDLKNSVVYTTPNIPGHMFCNLYYTQQELER